ncbi:lipid A export ATP-binding/permease protein msbA [Ceratocystis lukuohia]|uniref:Lipid A export ATP-binding/permease protein msbA n=1 Tax=Ceratocystis lukuohia TaxID=2019550 RepID=A0ABR4M8Z9_9PEZI
MGEAVSNEKRTRSLSMTEHCGGTATPKSPKAQEGSLKDLVRVFSYTDPLGWLCNSIAFIFFGRFVTTFNDFANKTITPSEYRSEVSKFTMYFVYIFIGRCVLVYIWSTLISISAIRTTKALRVDFIRQALRQEISFFDTPGSSIASKVTSNGNYINNGIAEKLGLIIQAVSTLIAAFVVAFVTQWKLTLILVGIVPVNLIITGVCVGIDASYETQMMTVFSHGLAIAEEAFSTIRTVHALWAHPIMVDKLKSILVKTFEIGRKKYLVYSVMYSIEFFLILGAYGLAFWQGIHRYMSGEFDDLGKIVTVIFTVIVAAQSLTQLAPQAMVLSKAIAAANEIFHVIDRKSAIDSLSESGLKPQSINGNIKLENVHFAYPSRPDVPVLKGLTLDIPAKKTTALVGSSGSGKSTIVGLVERWYVGQQGRITLDGVEISDLNTKWLRSNVRLVQQEPTLFSGSIYENVAYGLSSTRSFNSEEEQRSLVQEACKAAFAHDFIMKFPMGYDTVLGEKGATLSGGQKQRLVIARSIISDPSILLLDEATSALDPNAERVVQLALNNVSKGRTMVVIAHRLSTVRDADNIVVMDKGQIVEQGTHQQLMDSQGAYYCLVKAQDLTHGDDMSSKETHSRPEIPAIGVTQTSSAVTARGLVDTNPSTGWGKDMSQYGLLESIIQVVREHDGYHYIYSVSLVVCILAGFTYPTLAVLFAKVMEATTLPRDKVLEKTDFYSLMFFVLAIVNFFLWGIVGWLTSMIGQDLLRRYRLEIFENTLQQKMDYFDDPDNQTGTLVSRLSTEPMNMVELMSINVGIVIYNISNVASSSILALIVGWKLGLVLLFGALLPMTLGGLLKMMLEFRLESSNSAKFATSSGLASEAVMAIRTVSSLALESDVIARYEKTLHGITEKSCVEFSWIMGWYSLSQSMTFEAMTLGFWYGGRLVSTGEYSTTRFYIVFLAFMFSGEAAGSVFQFATNMTKAKISANYIFDLRNRLSKIKADDEVRGQTELPKGSADIAFKDIEPGNFIAFVGASGCGKTTMISLLEQFYTPTSGQIVFNGLDITKVNLCNYRSKIAIVQQEPILYQGSIRENVTMGLDPDSWSEDQVILACEQANIYDFISSLPDGLGTSCGRQGFSFSGGQRQRIAIARALIRKPNLLLLDEATSALDTESEKVVKQALDAASEGRTTIAVAHRLSTIKDADVIVLFSKGAIAEMGSHGELLRKRGMYFDMCVAQSLGHDS